MCFFGVGAPLGFGFSIGAGFSFTLLGGYFLGSSFRLRFIFGALLHCHYSRLFGSLRGFAGGGFHCSFALLLTVRRFRLHQLLIGLALNRCCIFLAGCNVRNSQSISCLKQFERRGAIDAKDRVLNMFIGG